MYDKISKVRAERFIELGILLNDIVSYDDKVPQKPIQHLRKLKRQFKAANLDPLLGKIIKADLKTIEVMEQYIIAHNAGDKVNARRYQTKLERMWEKTDRLVYAAIGRIDAYGN